MLNPIEAVGLIATRYGEEEIVLGSAFAFRHQNVFLTAAHCVGKLRPDELHVVSFAGGETRLRVAEIVAHAQADLVILRVEGGTAGIAPFWDFVSNYSWGEEFLAFGYPEDIFGERRTVTPRLFRGHFQRIYSHRSHLGYRYEAAELNIGAPAGLSGGPLFRPGAPVMLTALATENLESTTVLHSFEERQENGTVYRERNQQVITYGVALLLASVGTWLNDNIPPRAKAG